MVNKRVTYDRRNETQANRLPSNGQRTVMLSGLPVVQHVTRVLTLILITPV